MSGSGGGMVFYKPDGNSEIERLEMKVADLEEDLSRCRHQASYSIGGEEALKGQLAKIREIVNERLNTTAR